jgi:hypothetical protein
MEQSSIESIRDKAQGSQTRSKSASSHLEPSQVKVDQKDRYLLDVQVEEHFL